DEHDLVLTTYALLPRDAAELGKRRFHLLILDEAQNIKNATTKAAVAARELAARHRLCLTGTPLENHLGELWSLVHFLMPGWLGDARQFAQDYRTPIEKHGDEARLSHLAARLRPFLLRRTKEQVASELPPKSEFTQFVELSEAQRELYETVRLALDRKVREEIARRGLARSRIVILEALLKLR
ncbi:helicase, partial [Pseudomonas aeruginosa]|nr:helicase [Pseudomonas aeruginosa]